MNMLNQTGFLIRKFCDAKEGATAIEYVLIVGGLSIVIIGSAQALGVSLFGLYDTIRITLND